MKKTLWKRLLASVLCLTCLMGDPVMSYAQKDKKTQEERAEEKIKKAALDKMSKEEPTGPCQTMEELQYQMEAQKKIVPESNKRKDWPKGPMIQADSACLIDYDSGCLLYAKQADKKQYPASITKICTALVALENGKMSDELTFSADAINCVPPEYAHIALNPGEKLSLEEALYAMMLASANEVAYGIGENIGEKTGGGYKTFLQMMNEKAQSLGCVNTHFENTNGIYRNDHFVSASGMAKIARAAWTYPEFRKISESESYTIGETNLVDEKRIVHPTHMMYPKNAKYHYGPAVAGKTGFVFESLCTLVTYAKKDGRTLIAVILRDNGPETYTDTKALFEYGFKEFKNVETEAKDLVTLPVKEKLSDVKEKPLSKKDGKIAYAYISGETEVGYGEKKENLVKRVEKKTAKRQKTKKDNTVPEEEKTFQTSLMIKIFLTIAVVLEIVLISIRNKKKKRHKRKRKSPKGDRSRG